jgi:cysteine synthase A
LQGIGAGFVPAVYQAEQVDAVVCVEERDAFAMTVRAAREEGLLVGISSGASLAAVAQQAEQLPPGSRVLVFSYDSGERYLSIDDLFAG